jgi:ATP-binding cassette subfamily C protein CydC
LVRSERQRKQRLALGTLAHGAVTGVALAAVLGVLLMAASAGTLSAPAAAGLFFMAVATLEACAGASLAWRELQAARGAWRRLEATVAAKPAVRDPAAPLEVPTHALLELQDIGFQWADTRQPVLDRVNLRIAPGQRIAISGDSGAGKSSLMALLLRLCDPDAGQLRYGGIDVRHFAQADWHRQIAWLPQEAPVFAGSVRDNLLLGDARADDARLWQVLAQVRLDGLVRGLPGQLDAWVGEHGRTLSAGQARRIALARALLRDAPILLLDEPTEGLDVDTAHALLADLAIASAGRSVILISHDTLPAGVVDQRYLLRDGSLQQVA